MTQPARGSLTEHSGGRFPPLCTHQIPKVAERVPGELYNALRETALMADESSEDSGQAVASPVQHYGGGGSSYGCFRAATLCKAAVRKGKPSG